MAMECTAQRKVNIQRVGSIHPTLSTVLTLRDRLRGRTPTRAVRQSRAPDRPGSRTLNTHITTTPVRTVKEVLGILLGRTRITVKEAMRCLLMLRTPPASLSIPALRLRRGDTLVHMHRHSSSGRRVSSLHKTTTGILSVRCILQHGRGLELEHHHPTSPRINSINVLHRWGLNRDQHHLQIPPMESHLK